MIGTRDWEFNAGVNITQGFPFGTFMVKVGAFYSTGDGKLELGEYGIEYVKRLSDKWRLVAAVEGDQDAEQRIRPHLQGPRLAPEIDVLFSF